jgi:hypothetical protein
MPRSRLVAVLGLFFASVAGGLAVSPTTSAASPTCAEKYERCMLNAEITWLCRLGPPSPETEQCQWGYQTAVRGCHKNLEICNRLER